MDITDIKRAEEELAGKEAKLRTMVDNMPAHVRLRNKDGQFILVNRQYEEFYGIKNDEVLGKTLREISLNHVLDDVVEETEALDREVIKKNTIVEQEFEVVSEDGYRIVTDRIFPIVDSSGAVIEVGSIAIDITDLKRTEEALRESEAIVTEAVKIAQLGHWNWDELEDRMISCSDEYARIYGCSVEECVAFMSNSTGESNRTHLDDSDRVEAVHLEARKNSNSWDLEYRIKRPDGTIRHVRELGRPVLDDDGRLIRSNGTIQDITIAKESEAALRESETQFRTLVDNIPGTVYRCANDADWTMHFMSEEVDDVTGYPASDFIDNKARTYASILYPDDVQPVSDVITAALEKHEPFVLEYRIIHADGSIRWLYDKGQGTYDDQGAVLFMDGTFFDNTARKQAEEALRESEAIVNEAVKIAQLGHWIWDEVENKCIYCSEVCAQIYGLSKQEYLDRMNSSEAVIGYAHPEDRDRLRSLIAKGEAETSSWDVEYRILRPDGVVRYIRELSRPVLDNDGRMIQSNGTVQDITERKLAEEALQEANGVIKDQKDRMEDELNVAREIQMSMVPLDFPAFPDHDEFSIFATLDPAREVGGDFYDFYFLDEERLCVCIGDVAGKGVPSALFMAMAKTLIKSRSDDDHSTASILTHVNDELSVDNRNAMFVTIFTAILNIRTGEMVFTNAGHNPPYIKRADGTLQRLDQRHGPVIGALEGMVYKEDWETMASGDQLVLFTDGVTEAMNLDDQLFSEDKYVELLTAKGMDSPEKIVDGTVIAVEAFTGEADQTDDITVLALKYNGVAEDELVAEQQIIIKNQLPEITAVSEKFETFAEEFDIPQTVAMKFNIIFDELLNNVMSYAYTDDDEHDIEVRMERLGKRLTVTISDDGVPFNPLSMEQPDTDLSIEDREIGGMGIHLIRNLVDEVTYQRRIGKNVMTMMRNLEQEGGTSKGA